MWIPILVIFKLLSPSLSTYQHKIPHRVKIKQRRLRTQWRMKPEIHTIKDKAWQRVWQQKNFENRLAFGEVMAKLQWPLFSGHGVEIRF